MKKQILFWMSILPMFALAQQVPFDYKSYKLPDLKRKTLVVEGSARYDQNSADVSSVASSSSSNNTETMIPISVNYTDYVNTRKYMRWTVASLNGYEHDSETSANGVTSSSSNYRNAGASYSTMHRIYPYKRFYAQAGGSASVAYTYNKTSNENFVKDVTRAANASPYLGVGWGRFEDLIDYQQAYFLVSYLAKNNLLKKEANSETMQLVATKIAELNNKRVLDSRLKRIYELENLIEFLQSIGVVEPCGVKAIAQIDDIWSYGRGFARSYGLEFRVEAGAQFTYAAEDINKDYPALAITVDNDYLDHGISPFVDLVAGYHRPLGSKLQASASVRLGLLNDNLYSKTTIHRKNTDATVTTTETTEPLWKSSANISLTYQPNTRTSVSLSLSNNWQKRNLTDYDRTINYSAQSLNISYYISPRLQIYATQNYYINKTSDTSASSNQSTLDNLGVFVGFKYSIF